MDDDTRYLVSNLVKEAGWNINAKTISSDGLVAGIGTRGDQRYVVPLTPVPEPSTYAMLLAGGLVMLARSRSRRSA